MVATPGFDKSGTYTDARELRWVRSCDYLEPADALRLIDEGAEVVVEECARPPVSVRADSRKAVTALRDLWPKAKAEQAMTKTSVPTIYVAEEWRSDDKRMVMLVEGPPGPRAI